MGEWTCNERGRVLTEREDDLVVGVLLEVGKAGEILAAEGTEGAVVEGALETRGAKGLWEMRAGGWGEKRRTCWQGVVTGW